MKSLIFFLLFIAAPASALEVEQVRWGFDGQVVPGRFNPVSILVANVSNIPFDGAVNFYKTRGLEQRVGALYTTPCYLSPASTRWLQFYVYIENQYDQWRLEWGRRSDDRKEIETPKWGSSAQVLLSDSGSLISPDSDFKQFPDELFPSTVAATTGLGIVLLDHAPRWEPAKRQAFVDWLRGGGKVHLLIGNDGRYPVFSDELSILNSEAGAANSEPFRIGTGEIVRHAATAREIRRSDIEPIEAPIRKPEPDAPVVVSEFAESFLRGLNTLSHPRHDWPLIYLLAFGYLVTVGPGNFLIGRKLKNYRLRILLLLVTIAGFAWFFNMFGRSGQNQSSVVHTISYASPVNGNIYSVTQWINLFAAHGSHYTITHTAPHNLYATGLDYETVNGVIQSGKDGKFVVDMPLFSHRALLHQAKMKGADIPITIKSWDGADTLKELTVSVGTEFPKEIIEGWLVQNNRVYIMTVNDGELKFNDANKESLGKWLFPANEPPQVYFYNSPETDAATTFRKFVKPLIAWSLGVERMAESERITGAKDGRVQLFLFARSPEGFRVAGSQLGREIGYVLYHFDLFKPGT